MIHLYKYSYLKILKYENDEGKYAFFHLVLPWIRRPWTRKKSVFIIGSMKIDTKNVQTWLEILLFICIKTYAIP